MNLYVDTMSQSKYTCICIDGVSETFHIRTYAHVFYVYIYIYIYICIYIYIYIYVIYIYIDV